MNRIPESSLLVTAMSFGGGLSAASAFACDRASMAGINVAAGVIPHGHVQEMVAGRSDPRRQGRQELARYPGQGAEQALINKPWTAMP